MPGRRITDHQVLKYKTHRKTLSQAAASAKVAISERSGRRIEKSAVLPSQRQSRSWRTREDPLSAVWEAEVVPLLEGAPHLNAVTVLAELDRLHPGEYGAPFLRTLQRRLRLWRAVHGGEREVFFAQEHPPGRQGLSDFTVANELGVTIQGTPFPHRFYQFALAYSGWRHAEIVEGGESFNALSTGLQNALWRAGGIPQEHRTDSLSAAYKNLPDSEQNEFTSRYEALCTHYGMRATRCNVGESNENGSIESRNASFKEALRQALMLRGSPDFVDRTAYEAFVEKIVQRMNARVAARTVVERAALRPLPARRTAEFDETSARVSKYGIFTLKGVQYSAPSRLIGHRLTIRQYTERLECWFGGERVHECARATYRNGARHPRNIDYRHLIGGLKRKPGAFARWVLRDAMFPRTIYRQTWEQLATALPEREACKTIVGLLSLAAEGHEAELAQELEQLHERKELPDLDALRERLAPRRGPVPNVSVELPNLGLYDCLIEATV